MSKFVTAWGTAISITDRKESTYARNLTLRYPIRMPFDGTELRLSLSNLTGTEPVTITKTYVAVKQNDYQPLLLTFGGKTEAYILPGKEIQSDALPISIHAGDTIDVSLYLGDFTQMNAGTFVSGPLSGGRYSYGDFAADKELPLNLTRNTNWYYFLSTIDLLSSSDNHSLILYGDSITAQSWPDYLNLRTKEQGYDHVSVIRRAVSGTRILRQYDCITYQAYGLKGSTRFPIEIDSVAGANAVIIQHGINDIIHPVGSEVNPFRPWSDYPTLEEMIEGTTKFYIEHARKLGLKVWSGTLLPFCGWRTYNEDREKLRVQFNEWLRTSPLFDGCVDFAKAVCVPEHPEQFRPECDSGDHLHPSELGYKLMAEAVPASLLTE